MTPDEEDDFDSGGFQQPKRIGVSAGDVATVAAAAAAAALAAIAAGVVIRSQELLAMADRAGVVRFDVESTAIRSLAYSLPTGAMAVTFTDGSVYPYPPVSLFNFLRFVNSRANEGSIGRFYNREVRGKWG
jgi:hypothetical protein